MEADSEWQLAAHPVFLSQLHTLANSCEMSSAVEQLAKVQVLAMLSALCLYIIPANPLRSEYEFDEVERGFCGAWQRASFGARRFMLLFRADADARIIVYGRIVDLQTTPRTLEDGRAVVMHGRVCPITSAGRIRFPAAIKELLGGKVGGRISLHVSGARQAMVMEPVHPGRQSLFWLALQLRSPLAEAKRLPGGKARVEKTFDTSLHSQDTGGLQQGVTSGP